jgi:membrane-associated phospholipid phosphatase
LGMSDVEVTIFRYIYDRPDSLRQVAVLVTHLGTPWFLLLLAAVLLVTHRKSKLPLLVLRNGALAYVCTYIVKVLVNRPRPYLLLDGVVPLDTIAHGAGFPSAHMALATAVGLMLWPDAPRGWRRIILLWIITVAWSRLYLGVHAPLDIVGGLTIGALVASIPAYLGLPKHKRRRKLKKEV